MIRAAVTVCDSFDAVGGRRRVQKETPGLAELRVRKVC